MSKTSSWTTSALPSACGIQLVKKGELPCCPLKESNLWVSLFLVIYWK